MEFVLGVLKESYYLFGKMAPYLLFGFFFAGVLHVFVKTDSISSHLGSNGFLPVVKASLFGIPLPLCSCSVIPTAMSLKKEGASRGAVLSFLISAPTTGADSILATYSLLGGFFTIYRIVAAFITGVFSGSLTNIFVKISPDEQPQTNDKCKCCDSEEDHSHNVKERVIEVFRYAFTDLLDDSGKPLILGILLGGVISFFLPESLVETYMGSGLMAMVVMLLVGIPMYVCATASIPIAVALMAKGMAPGAAFVFLMAGPATNIVTMSIVANNLGKRSLLIYLSSISFCAITMGLLMDKVYSIFYQADISDVIMHHHGEQVSPAISIAASVVLLSLIAYNTLRKRIT